MNGACLHLTEIDALRATFDVVIALSQGVMDQNPVGGITDDDILDMLNVVSQVLFHMNFMSCPCTAAHTRVQS